MVLSNERVIRELIEHLRLGKHLVNRRRTPISERTAYKYKIWLRKLDGWLGKPFVELAEADVDGLRNKLRNDVLRRGNGRPYEDSTKRDVEVKFLKTLLYFVKKPELALFVSSYKEDTEIPAISKGAVESIVAQSRLRDKVIFQVLFDGGFRASEFLNVRFRDVKDDALAGDGYYKIRITKSKTVPRTVGLTLPLTTDVLREWLEVNKDKAGSNLPLVSLSHRHLALIIRRLSLRVLKQRLTPHQLRHSSATYYCHYLNQYQMCKRYGWSMSSNMPQRYIDREGVDDELINKKVVQEETMSFRRTVESLKEKVNTKNEHIVSMEARLKEQEKRLRRMDEVLTALANERKLEKSAA